MNSNPWLMEKVVKTMLDEDRGHAVTALLQGTASPRGDWSRHVGEAMIRAGQRLAGPEPTRRDAQGLGAGC
jgi:hypothetical protein